MGSYMPTHKRFCYRMTLLESHESLTHYIVVLLYFLEATLIMC
jgi:hypothetical protein